MPRAAKIDPLLQARRRDFGNFVRRTYNAARARGMSVRDIEKATDIGSTTIYGWRDGRWTRDPVAALVNQFCDGLGASRAEAYRALRWGETPNTSRRVPEPIEDPELRKLARKLSDPNVSDEFKRMARQMIKVWLGE